MLSDVRKEDENLRLESEFFKKNCLAMNEKLLKFKTESLDFYSLKITDGTHYTPQYQEAGIPFLSALNVKENYLNVNAGYKFISQKEHLELTKRCKPQPNDVLLRKVGVGARWACLVPENIFEFSIFVSVALIKLNKKINPYYVTTFINSDLGQAQLLRFNKGISQPDLHLEEIKKLKIPFLSEDFQGRIESLVKLSHSKVGDSQKLYSQAEFFLLKILNLASITPNTEKVNIKSFQNSFGATGRLDAEYYQKKYEVYESRIKENKKGFTTIKHEYDLIATVSKRHKPYYNYIEIGDVNVSDGSAKFNRVETSDLPANAKHEVKRGDLLISTVRPNRGAVTIINFDADDLIVSGAFTVLREKEDSIFSNETLKVLLRTKIYSDWLLKFNIGTQYPVIKDEDILNLPIPKIEQSIQKDAASLVQESFSLKAESERLLDVAKKAVEMAIEHNEETAIKFLTMETK